MPAARSFKKEICSLFGQPVAENPTAYMIERAFDHHGLDWRYITLEVPPADLGDAVRGMRAMGFRGGNCTIPHKVAVIPFLDRLSNEARSIGAVNCIVREGSELVGHNTDGKGFLKSLRELVDPAGTHVAILGAGGAARAIAVEVGLAGAAEVLIVNRNAERGRELAENLRQNARVPARFVPWPDAYRVPESIDILINATPVGLYPKVNDRLALDVDSLQRDLVVADVVFNPPETRLLADARARGCRTLDGLGMLVNQGVIGFQLWTGIDPNPNVMRAALSEVFGL